MTHSMKDDIAISFCDFEVSVGEKRKTKIFGPFTKKIHIGDNVSLTGPSGCGKTTVLNQIVDHVSGQEVTNSLFCIQGKWDYFPQNNFLLPWYSARRNLMALDDHNLVHSMEAQILSEELGIKDVLDAPYSSLSGGERQRIGLWILLLRKPGVVLIDEPFTALDLKMKLKCLSLLGEYLSSDVVTSIMVSHDLDVLTYIADVLWYMNPDSNEIVEKKNNPLKNYDLENYKNRRISNDVLEIFNIITNG